VNSDFSDIATALTDSIAADGQTPITSPLKQGNGTLSLPAWTFVADTSAGLYLAAVGNVGLVAGGFGIQVNSIGVDVTAAVASAAGSGYVVGELITLTGGTAVKQAILQVATLSGSGVATVTIFDGGLYTTAPSNPASQGSTSGIGSGATFTLTTGVTDLVSSSSGTALWQLLGSTSYMASAMVLANGLALANYIGASNLAAAIQTSLPLPVPEGYLTPVSNQPVITSDSTGASIIYYTPFMGTWAVIHNGTTVIPYQFTQLSLTLTSSQAANSLYDVFLAYNANSPVIGTGPAWTAGSAGSVTPGSCARGTGVGGTALARLNGIWTNAVSMSLIYNTGSGNNTITVPINQGIYLGTIYIDATAGQVTSHVSAGQNRKYGIWNNYNRKPITLVVNDTTSTWTFTGGPGAAAGHPASYSATVFNVGSGTASNGVTALCGLPEEVVISEHQENIDNTAGSGSDNTVGIGLNTLSAFSGTIMRGINAVAGQYQMLRGNFIQQPALGLNVHAAVVQGSSTSFTFIGNNNMQLTQYRA
jgi:hypothetical protein